MHKVPGSIPSTSKNKGEREGEKEGKKEERKPITSVLEDGPFCSCLTEI